MSRKRYHDDDGYYPRKRQVTGPSFLDTHYSRDDDRYHARKRQVTGPNFLDNCHYDGGRYLSRKRQDTGQIFVEKKKKVNIEEKIRMYKDTVDKKIKQIIARNGSISHVPLSMDHLAAEREATKNIRNDIMLTSESKYSDSPYIEDIIHILEMRAATKQAHKLEDAVVSCVSQMLQNNEELTLEKVYILKAYNREVQCLRAFASLVKHNNFEVVDNGHKNAIYWLHYDVIKPFYFDKLDTQTRLIGKSSNQW